MRYELYTTVDITSTGQYRPGADNAYKSEQNFQTVLQTIGLRANISYDKLPQASNVNGKLLGFNTSEIIKVWIFEFETERDFLFQVDEDPVGYLIKDFEGVPYIAGLDESMTQNYDVFVTEGAARNIIFQIKQ
jgi:hypothetical protein